MKPIKLPADGGWGAPLPGAVPKYHPAFAPTGRCRIRIPRIRNTNLCPLAAASLRTRRSIRAALITKGNFKNVFFFSRKQSLPRTQGRAATLMFNGRAYSVAAGSTIDVPNMDAQICAANGWVQVGNGSGTTAQRPTLPYVGQLYVDTTLGYMVVFEGTAWRNPATAAVV